MSGRLLLAWGLLLTIPLLGLLGQWCLDELCSSINGLLSGVEDAEDAELLAEAISLWQQHLTFVSLLIPREEADSVTAALGRTMAFCLADEEGELSAALTEVRHALTIVRTLDRPCLHSVF